MRYKINRGALTGFVAAVLLFVLRAITVVSGATSTTVVEADMGQGLFNLFVDSIATLLTLSIAVLQSYQNIRHNKLAFWINVAACITCCASFFTSAQMWFWHEYGTYIGLLCVLISMSIVPKSSADTEISNVSEKNNTTKIAASVLAVIILIVAIVSFVKGNPQYVISNGIICLFSLVILLLVWDSIESFSLSNIVTLTKKVKDKEKENKALTSENRELRAQFLSIVQNKQIFNVEINNGKAQVEPAIQDDSDDQGRNVEFDQIDTIIEVDSTVDRDARYRKILPELVSSKAIDKFADKNNISSKELQKDVKFSQKFIEGDPIMGRMAVFDAYAKRSLDEIFIEVKFPSMVMDDRMYYLLSQISRYANSNKVNAKLVIIFPKFSKTGLEMVLGCSARNQERLPTQLRSRYKPAIENGLLEIAEIEITDEEVEKMKRDLESK